MWTFSRKKPFNFFLSALYRLNKLIPNSKIKFIFFSNLSWLFYRISRETSSNIIPHDKNYIYNESIKFITSYLNYCDNVLDLGCGSGELTKKISAYVNKCYGVDHDINLINKAKKKNSNKRTIYICTDLKKFLNKKKKFEILILSHVLEHIDNPKNFLRSIKGYFKKIYIEIPDNDSDQINHLRNQMKVSLLWHDDDHVTEFTRQSFEKIVKLNKYIILKKDYKYGVMKYWIK